jgi:hypothetical protein
MAVSQVLQADVDELLASGELSVSGHYSWREASNKAWIKIDIPVWSEARHNLKICLSLNREEPSLYSFALIFNNAFRVRAVDFNGSHTNKHTDNNEWIGQTHKHKWTDKCNDRFAYTPTDITSLTLEDQLKEFCNECGIDCSVTIDPLPPSMAQGVLYNVV